MSTSRIHPPVDAPRDYRKGPNRSLWEAVRDKALADPDKWVPVEMGTTNSAAATASYIRNGHRVILPAGKFHAEARDNFVYVQAKKGNN